MSLRGKGAHGFPGPPNQVHKDSFEMLIWEFLRLARYDSQRPGLRCFRSLTKKEKTVLV